MPNTLNAGLLFLIQTLFDLYLFILVVRIILVYVGSNYYDPVTQFVIKLTDFIIKPLRRYIPNMGRIESVSVLVVVILEVLKYLLTSVIMIGMPNILGLVILALGDFLKIIISSFFYAILMQAILSWVQPHSPVNQTLYRFTSPIMQPIRRLIPPISGIDITPIPVIIALQFLLIVLVSPLMTIGYTLAQ